MLFCCSDGIGQSSVDGVSTKLPRPSACMSQTGKSPWTRTEYLIVHVFANFCEAASRSKKSIRVEITWLSFISHSRHVELCHHRQNKPREPGSHHRVLAGCTGTEQGPQSSFLNPGVGLWSEHGRIDTILRLPSCRQLGPSWKPKAFLCEHPRVM